MEQIRNNYINIYTSESANKSRMMRNVMRSARNK